MKSTPDLFTAVALVILALVIGGIAAGSVWQWRSGRGAYEPVEEYNGESYAYTPPSVEVRERPILVPSPIPQPTPNPDYRWMFSLVDGEESRALRERTIEELGGLEFNEFYHFQTDDGRYAIITGWRVLETAEELNRYFADLNLPQQVGDFQLVGVAVNDIQGNWVRFNYHPMQFHTRGITLYPYRWWEDENPSIPDTTPIDEVLVRFVPAFGLRALYENSNGSIVSLEVWQTIMSSQTGIWRHNDVPFTTVDMGLYGEIHFLGENGEYLFASYGHIGIGYRSNHQLLNRPHSLGYDIYDIIPVHVRLWKNWFVFSTRQYCVSSTLHS